MSVEREDVVLPPDSHVHSQWSWDAVAGSMEATCARAVELGVPSLAFTEHADFTPTAVPAGAQLPSEWQPMVHHGVLTPPALDVDGYRATLERCRARYPALRILSGVELGEPHWHRHEVGALLQRGSFERVLASVHAVSTAVDGTASDVGTLYASRPAPQVVRDYLAETVRLVEEFADFEVLAHIDYPVRYWPREAGPYDPGKFEDDYRSVLRALALAGKTLEVNTQVPLRLEVLRWWHAEGGQAITFASDAHRPDTLARGFPEAVRMAESAGFRPTLDPFGFWSRA